MFYHNVEYVAMAAIWYKDGKIHEFQKVYGIKFGFVLCGFRHPYIHSAADVDESIPYIEGFVTSYGRFVDRSSALTIAIRTGQVKESDVHLDMLYSEDIFKFQINAP